MNGLLKHILEQNPALRSYFYYTGILSLKMMLMPLLTIRQRFKNNAFVSEEDASFCRGKEGKVSRTNENVERVRRCHRNDMENVYLFLITGFAYCWTEPDPSCAHLLFLSFSVSRFIHTFVYAVVIVPQPARGLAWLTGFLINGFMALRAIVHFCN